MMHQPRRQQLTADLWAKAGELEKQFASYKKKVEKSDQAKDESTSREKKDGSRGEYYERYMRIRDVKLREQLSLQIERKQSEMTAMWEKLEKSRAEMAVRFGGAVGRAGPVRTPSPSSSKKTVQLKREFSDEKKGQNVTPRSTNASSKRHGTPTQITPSSSQSSTTRTSTIPQSPKRSNTNSTNQTRSLQRLKSPARSAAIFSDLRKENKTLATPRTRVLTKSHSLVLEKNNARGLQKKAPQTVNISSRLNESSTTLESEEDDQIALTTLEETPQTGTDTFFEPDITIEDDILPKLHETLTEMLLNQKIEQEISSVLSSSSQVMLDQVEPNNENNDNNENRNNIEPDIANASDNIVSNVNSILNPAMDDEEESSGGSSRSWCSNLETSFSRSTVDPAIDSPILSPRGGGSTSFRFLPEPTTIRVRKKWESRSINSPRGIKRFLSFSKKNKETEIFATDMISPHAGLSSIFTDDESDNASNVINQMSLVSYDSNGSRNEIESENGDRLSVSQQAHALTGSLASSGAKYDLKEDCLPVNSQKSHRSFFSFPPFLFRGAESKIRS